MQCADLLYLPEKKQQHYQNVARALLTKHVQAARLFILTLFDQFHLVSADWLRYHN